MSRLFLPRHHRTHERGGSDEMFIPAGVGGGAWHQQIPLRYFGAIDQPPGWDYDGYQWVNDASSGDGGYVEATLDGDHFSCLVLLAPKGSIWQLNVRMSEGPDYGRWSFYLASLLYESALRPDGDPTGKIGPVDGGYGSFTYIGLQPGGASYNYDGYAVADTGDHTMTASIPFIVGGDEGDPLTDFDTGVTDSYTGFTIMDGGPGWYRLKVETTGKDASSSGYRVRISDILLNRRADDNAP